MSLDIHTAIQTALILAVIIILFSLWSGIRSIRTGKNLKFFRMRRDRVVHGWRMIFFAFTVGVIAFFMDGYAEPVIYRLYPPTPTLTLTPTITLTPTVTRTPTITLTPTITPTPAVSDTPTITPTPHVPLAVEVNFTSQVTPPPGVIFSPLEFAQDLDENYNPVNPAVEFQNPVGHMYARFSYVGMAPEVQWTAIWYREGELVHYETKPWDGAAGGYGYTDWDPEPEKWLPGEYEVQLFVGLDWIVSGRFTVTGDAPTPAASRTPTASLTPTPTLTPTRTLSLTPTLSPTRTSTRTAAPNVPEASRTATLTRTPFPTPTLTATRAATATRVPTSTRAPTPTPTRRLPTPTLGPTATKAPTSTPMPPTPANTHAPTPTKATPGPTSTRAPTATPRNVKQQW